MTGPMINHERLKQRRSEGSRGGVGWKPKEGENRVRVLPPHSRYLAAWDVMEDIAIGFEMHYFRAEGQQQSTEVSRCPKDLKQLCPACDAYWAYRESTDPGLKELARQVKSGRVYLMNLIDISNIAAGIQHWGGNYTCWDKILEIVANPMWGNVLDPANGVNFFINLIPKNRSKTGFPQYSVMPEPQRTTVMEVLATIPDWQAQLDELEQQIPAMKTAAEIQALLDAMRIPPVGGQARTPLAARSVMPPAGVVAPVSALPAAAPMVAPAVAPVAPVPITMVSAPAPVAVRPVSVAPVASAAADLAVARAAFYDPGPEYTPKVPDAERPVGAPRCFGDYDPLVRPCNPCASKGSCQMKMLGIA